MYRDIPPGLTSDNGRQFGIAVLLHSEELAEAGLAELMPGESLSWVLLCELGPAQLDRFTTRKRPPDPALHVLDGQHGVSHAVIVCETEGFQQRVVVPMVGPAAAQFAHSVETRRELTVLLSDAAGRATLVHWGIRDMLLKDWAAKAVLKEPDAPDAVLDEVIELGQELLVVDALESVDAENRIDMVGVAVYASPQMERAMRARASRCAAAMAVH